MADRGLADILPAPQTRSVFRLVPPTSGDVGAFRLSPTQRILAWRLLEPRLITTEEYVHALYADREDGGPLDPEGHIQVQMYRLRRKLQPFGVSVIVRRGQGWVLDRAHIDTFRALLVAELLLMHAFAQPSHHALRYDERRLLELAL